MKNFDVSGTRKKVEFERKLNTGDSKDTKLDSGTSQSVIWAYSNSGGLRKHDSRGSLTLWSGTGGASSTTTATTTDTGHDHSGHSHDHSHSANRLGGNVNSMLFSSVLGLIMMNFLRQ